MGDKDFDILIKDAIVIVTDGESTKPPPKGFKSWGEYYCHFNHCTLESIKGKVIFVRGTNDRTDTVNK